MWLNRHVFKWKSSEIATLKTSHTRWFKLWHLNDIVLTRYYLLSCEITCLVVKMEFWIQQLHSISSHALQRTGNTRPIKRDWHFSQPMTSPVPLAKPIALEKKGGTSCNVMQIRRSGLLVPPFCVSRTVNQNRKKSSRIHRSTLARLW